jgi:hypothetical protein
VTPARFTRELRGGETGPDVEGVGRALARAGFLDGLTKFVQKQPSVRRTYGDGKKRGVNRARAKIKLAQTGVYDRRVHEYLERLDAFDAYAEKLMLDYAPTPTLVYPVTPPWKVTICQGLHETGGLPGNWAIDFCCQPGAGIVAVEKGRITRLSGHPPGADQPDGRGVFGWSVSFTTPKGYGYFVTHLGWRLAELELGMTVEAGDLLGKVGDQHFRPDHGHYGVSSPLGPSDAKKRILAVAGSPRVS